MKATKQSLVLLVLLTLAACSAQNIQKSIDTYSNTVDLVSHEYQAIEKELIRLHDTGTISKPLWLQISQKNVRDVNPAMQKVWDSWEYVGKNSAQIDLFLSSPDFLKALGLVLDLAKLAGVPASIERLSTIQTKYEEMAAARKKVKHGSK